MGFWLGYCAPALALRGTFLDPVRFGDSGLPVLLWHKPRDSKSPRPSSLEHYLQREKLRDRPLLILADEEVDSEDRAALRSVTAGAALLDERDLLRIIPSSSDLPSNHDPTRARQLHFAAAVSSQLPATQASPFRETGPASSGMFFGRRDVLAAFRDPVGPTILFGGRRLGKSSILHELKRQFTEDDAGRNVGIYVDCLNAGTTPESVLRLVQEIAEQIARFTPIVDGGARPLPFRGQFPRPNSVREFVDSLRSLLRDHPQYRILLLLDEADMLCEYLDIPPTGDLSDTQRLGWELRSLVAESQGRFDVRFAGFQEIQRTTLSTGGPFFNFRPGWSNWPLKVFQPEEAIDLLVSTLRGLAVEFSDVALIDRVLSFTGRHPALLQDLGHRLYRQIRERNSNQPWRIRAEDVDAVMLNPEFRKQVVNTIHLNVSRHTRPQRILALLLYLWVQQIMAPQAGETPREARTARDLFDLVGQILGLEAQRQLDVAAIESYLGDLEVLGVLERRGQAYVFAYRAFAALLYHDYFAGGLGRQILEDAWKRIESDTQSARRLWLTTPTGHTLSPLPRETQDRLLTESGRSALLLLGPAGSGLTLLADWFGQQPHPDHPTTRPLLKRVRLTTPDSAGLREGLLEALSLPPSADSTDWLEFWAVARPRAEQVATGDEYTTVLVDTVDQLAQAEDIPLCIWDEATALSQDDLFGLLGALTRASRGRLRFLFTGGLPTARLWIENVDTFAKTVAWFRTERLSRSELPAWLDPPT